MLAAKWCREPGDVVLVGEEDAQAPPTGSGYCVKQPRTIRRRARFNRLEVGGDHLAQSLFVILGDRPGSKSAEFAGMPAIAAPRSGRSIAEVIQSCVARGRDASS